jgi:hypothetical protein
MEFRRQALKQACRVSAGQHPYKSDHSNRKSIEIEEAALTLSDIELTLTKVQQTTRPSDETE